MTIARLQSSNPWETWQLTYKRPEDLLADHGRCGVVGLRQWPTFADFEEDVIGDALDVLVDESLALFGEFHCQLRDERENGRCRRRGGTHNRHNIYGEKNEWKTGPNRQQKEEEKEKGGKKKSEKLKIERVDTSICAGSINTVISPLTQWRDFFLLPWTIARVLYSRGKSERIRPGQLAFQ